MTPRALLAEIAGASGQIEVRGDRPRLWAPRPLPPDLVARVVDAKPALLAILSDGIEWHAQQEQSINVERKNRIPCQWAAGFAQLDPDRPPADVPLPRWQHLIDEVGRFLDCGFAAQATALGWRAFDLFGCDRDRPFTRIDQAGLLWLLNGGKLVALTETTATIEISTDVRQTYRRQPSERDRVLAWELVS